MNNISSANKNVYSNGAVDVREDYYNVEEESGWSAYMEEFSCSDNGSFTSSPSLASDAAWYGSELKTLNLNKTKNRHRQYSCHRDLEDTATSPVNSPKVSSWKQKKMMSHQRAAGNVREKQGGCSSRLMEGKREKKGKMSGVESRNSGEDENRYVDDLRQKGLCVVPMSQFIDYFG